MAKKLSDINLHGDRRKAEKIYERALSGGEGSIEASKQLEKPRFKSFLKDIIDKRNAGVGRGGSLVKDPEPDIIKEELKKTAEKLQDILRIKRSNERLRSKLENAKRIKRPGDTPVKKRLGLGKLASAAVAPASSLLGILGALAKIGMLQWLADIQNVKVVQDLVKIFKGIVELFGTSLTNIGQGWAKLTGDGSLAEKLVGFFELITGLTLMKWLVNPRSMLKDFPRIFKAIKKMPGVIKNMMTNPVKYTQKAFEAQLKKLFPNIFKKGFRAAGKRAALKIFGNHGVKMMKAIHAIIKRQVAKAVTTATKVGGKGVLQTVKTFLSKNKDKIARRMPWLKKIPFPKIKGGSGIVSAIIDIAMGEDPDRAVAGGFGFWASTAWASKLFAPVMGVPKVGWVLYPILVLGTGLVGETTAKNAYDGIKSWLNNFTPPQFGIKAKTPTNPPINPERADWFVDQNGQHWIWNPDPYAKEGEPKGFWSTSKGPGVGSDLTNSPRVNDQSIEKSSINSELNKLSKNNVIDKKINKKVQATFVSMGMINNNTNNAINIATGPFTNLNNLRDKTLEEALV